MIFSNSTDRQATQSIKTRVGPQGEVILLCLVLSSFSVSSIFLSKIFGYLLVAAAFGASCLWLLATNQVKLVAPKLVIWPYVIVLCLFLPGTIQKSSTRGIARLITFMIVTTVLVFFLIRNVNFERFWRWYGIVTAIIVILGLPTIFIDQYSLGSMSITAYRTTPAAPIDIRINTISSIFTNPNHLALVCCFAVVGLVVTQKLSKGSAILVGINAFGVFVADGQAAQLAVIGGLGIFAMGLIRRSFVTPVTTLALGVIITGLLMLFQIIPGPEYLSTFSLSGRRHLWSASVQAINAKSLIGYGTVDMSTVLLPYITDPRRLGAGPHNSYIRIALSGGLLCGLAYLFLHLYGLIQSARSSTRGTLASNSLLWSVIILQLFNGKSLFGLSPSSILFAVALGWTVRELSDEF